MRRVAVYMGTRGEQVFEEYRKAEWRVKDADNY